MQLIDTHCHLDDHRFDKIRTQIIHNAKLSGVTSQIIPATTSASWPIIKTLCTENTQLYPAYGLHPFFIDQLKPNDIDLLQLWINNENPVALGECGLDYFITQDNKKEQQELFETQLNIASKNNLPVILHANRAVEDIIHFIKKCKHHQGVVHSYNGSWQQAKSLIDLGYKISIGGAVTYHRALRIREILRKCPIESLLIETDAPDQPPSNHKGSLNQPAFLMDIFKIFCELRTESAEVLASALNHNANTLFNLKSKS